MVWLLLMLTVSPAHAKKRKDDPPPPEPPELMYQDTAPVQVQPGSLWNEVPARRMLGLDNNARQVGDLVTVRIVEYTATSLDAQTSLSRESNTEAGIEAMFGAETTVTNANPGMGGQIALRAGSSTEFDGAGVTGRGSAVESMVTCEVIEVLPSGNLRIWGYKQVRVNREVQYVVVEGIVRPRDIQMDNSVRTDLMAHAVIEVTGKGVVSEKQGPGLGQRLVDILWPF